MHRRQNAQRGMKGGRPQSTLSSQGRNGLSHGQTCPLVLPSTMASLPARAECLMTPCLQIAPMEVGRINIQYRRTECTPPEPLDVDINHNFGAGAWLRIVVSVRFPKTLTNPLAALHASQLYDRLASGPHLQAAV